MIPDHLRIQPGQEALTPEQEAEAERFADERIAAQLSTEPVNEPEAEQLLQQAYIAVKLPPPERIQWVDGPSHLAAVLARKDDALSEWRGVWGSVQERVQGRVSRRVRASILKSMGASVGVSVARHVEHRVRANVWWGVGSRLKNSVDGSSTRSRITEASIWVCVAAYEAAHTLARSRFFDEYLAPNALHALAHLNEFVSGYWLGKKSAVLVRRPRVLARDAEGRLHSATGKCIEYADGWGRFHAWHGVHVPEQVILAPETLTREDYLREPNVEVRRVMQERMGEHFVPKLSGQVIDSSPRGALYEVALPRDPERVARYVQVQDASTSRQYFLRVPPTIQTAAEAVAWSFHLLVEEYDPSEET